jgi:predicted nucleotidyltransferase
MVDSAARAWAADVIASRSDVLKIGYFGSYARGDWGVGSDLDLIVIIDESPQAFEARGSMFDTTTLPVPVDLLVYTTAEWDALVPRSGFARSANQEAVWIGERGPAPPCRDH